MLGVATAAAAPGASTTVFVDSSAGARWFKDDDDPTNSRFFEAFTFQAQDLVSFREGTAARFDVFFVSGLPRRCVRDRLTEIVVRMITSDGVLITAPRVTATATGTAVVRIETTQYKTCEAGARIKRRQVTEARASLGASAPGIVKAGFVGLPAAVDELGTARGTFSRSGLLRASVDGGVC